MKKKTNEKEKSLRINYRTFILIFNFENYENKDEFLKRYKTYRELYKMRMKIENCIFTYYLPDISLYIDCNGKIDIDKKYYSNWKGEKITCREEIKSTFLNC